MTDSTRGSDAPTDRFPVLNGSDLAAVISAAQRSVAPIPLTAGMIYDIVDGDGKHTTLDTLDLAEKRLWKNGTFNFNELESLIAYVNAHRTAGTSIWCDEVRLHIDAVINGNIPGDDTATAAGWEDHRAVLQLNHSPEWKRWVEFDGVLRSQADFAQHIEDGSNEIVSPEAATMLELAATLEATTSVEFKEATRLQSGSRQFRYEETVVSRAGTQGTIEIPDTFELGLAPFIGSDPYRVVARLRYKITANGLQIGYRLVRPEDVIRAAFMDNATKLENECEGVPVYHGVPPRAIQR